MIEFEEKGYDLEKLKPYEDFLMECSQKDYSNQGTHKHHILPKFMKGSNKKINLIVLNYQDHFDAHLILANCFPENTREYRGNILSANHLKKNLDSLADLSKEMSIAQTGRIVSDETKKKISKLKKEYFKNLKEQNLPNPNCGRKLTEERKQQISKQKQGNTYRLGKPHSEKTRALLREKRKEMIITPESRIKATETRRNNGKLWHSKDGLRRISESRKGTYQGGNKISLIHIETGLVFETKKDAAEHFGVSLYFIGKGIIANDFRQI